MDGHIGPLNYAIESRMGIIFEYVVQFFLKHIPFGLFVLGVTPNHKPLKNGCLI